MSGVCFHGQGHWSKFLHQRFIHFVPKIGGGWRDNIRWLFLTNSVAKIPNTRENALLEGFAMLGHKCIRGWTAHQL